MQGIEGKSFIFVHFFLFSDFFMSTKVQLFNLCILLHCILAAPYYIFFPRKVRKRRVFPMGGGLNNIYHFQIEKKNFNKNRI